MDPSASSIQSQFLDQIKKRISPNLSFADELSEILSISRDSVYRRIRGETILSLEEAKILFNHFGVSIDALFSDSSEMVTFHRRVVNSKDYSIEQWLNSILKNLEYLKTFSENELIFSAKDIPMFHYFRLPELSAFKFFFWMKTLVGYPEYEHLTYSKEAVPNELLALGGKVAAKYASIPSIEIWNEEVLYDTLKQIEFYHDCNFFEDRAHARHLCDQLVVLLDEVKSEAASGLKSAGGMFNLYNNEILIADNTVFARMGKKRCVYVNQNALNLLLTLQEPFCEQVEIYLKNLLSKSILISKTAEKERNRFFNNIRKRIESFKERLN